MDYYTRPKRKNKKYKKIILLSIAIFIIFNLIILVFDKKVMPSVLAISETTMRNETIKIINETTLEVFNEEFGDNGIVQISKDSKGNISLIQADTLKMNKLSAEIATRCNKKFEELGENGIEVPLGWMTDNSVYYNLGPMITIQMEPLGNIETSYESAFEGAGINQTRHKIYLKVKARIKIIIPMYSEEIEVQAEVPLSEVIIVGNIPDTAIDFGGGIKTTAK
ncbi:MAG: sporulation protein YunB [Clostridium sp.]|uniref:sporulation protein YunB n=1 Tax=Clostridium chrysemydis TaxID=2665504 RepID=UPI003EE6284E